MGLYKIDAPEFASMPEDFISTEISFVLVRHKGFAHPHRGKIFKMSLGIRRDKHILLCNWDVRIPAGIWQMLYNLIKRDIA